MSMAVALAAWPVVSPRRCLEAEPVRPRWSWLVHPAVAALGRPPRTALILGGGDGLAARELLHYKSIEHITLVGHSNGGDVSMYVAHQHPELVSKVITLDNLRVPFVVSENMKILSFRSRDPHFVTDPGVLPTAEEAKARGIDIVHTGAQHTEMSDRGPDAVKEKIQETLDRFLRDTASSALAPADTKSPMIMNPGDY